MMVTFFTIGTPLHPKILLGKTTLLTTTFSSKLFFLKRQKKIKKATMCALNDNTFTYVLELWYRKENYLLIGHPPFPTTFFAVVLTATSFTLMWEFTSRL